MAQNKRAEWPTRIAREEENARCGGVLSTSYAEVQHRRQSVRMWGATTTTTSGRTSFTCEEHRKKAARSLWWMYPSMMLPTCSNDVRIVGPAMLVEQSRQNTMSLHSRVAKSMLARCGNPHKGPNRASSLRLRASVC